MLVTVTESGKTVFRLCDSPNGKIWRYGEPLTVKPAFMVSAS